MSGESSFVGRDGAGRVLTTGLYVPGDRPDRFGKAVATGAELIILDLEDAVAPAAKARARAAVVAWLRDGGGDGEAGGGDGGVVGGGGEGGADARGARADGPVLQVRVNEGNDDDLVALAVLATTEPAGTAACAFEVRLPKVESTVQLDRVGELLPGVPVTALIESAQGVERAAELAAHPIVTRLALGESDLASELGTRAPAVMEYARLRLLFAALAAGLPAPMLSAYPAIADLEGLRADTARGRELGWWGRVAIHPSQLPVIAEVFAPSADELRWARDVLAAVGDGGVATLANGDMVDAAMLPRARAILARSAGRSGGVGAGRPADLPPTG
ncbi:aldolase/citrate lyase family protein [Herbiconiux sp. CPCC 205763]|uniref:Aldolase/citrate lyase family protein n=1 Tax=Herbiconiux aconitum TaxID=2970913 RepID=A0ABT2GQK7_9MICO|nr:aldolase/citrate lyase family protein [Herbiconiux aconitum]MCS5718416.1 aldolase/citrate lyase family protein [Herbiconiux aconitum]